MKRLKNLVPVLAVLLGSAGFVTNALAVEVGSHLNGGVGLDSRHEMHAQRGHYNLRLAFAEGRSGEYLTGVKLTLKRDNAAAMQFEDCGPLFYVKVKPGHYRITADYEGKRQTMAVNVGAKGEDHVMHWR